MQNISMTVNLGCRDAARSQRVLAMNVVRQLIRLNERYCRHALTAWRLAVEAKHAKRAMLQGAIQRMAAAKARAVIHAWAQHVRERRARRQHRSAIVQKVDLDKHHPCPVLVILRLHERKAEFQQYL